MKIERLTKALAGVSSLPCRPVKVAKAQSDAKVGIVMKISIRTMFQLEPWRAIETRSSSRQGRWKHAHQRQRTTGGGAVSLLAPSLRSRRLPK